MKIHWNQSIDKSTLPLIKMVLFSVSILIPVMAQNLQLSNLKSSSIQCDYLVVCPKAFLSSALTLAAFRNTYQFDDVSLAKVVTLDTIYSQFPVADSLGKSYSLWYALKYANENWSKKPEYVVLLGDDSVRYRAIDSLRVYPYSVGLLPTFYTPSYINAYNNKVDTNLRYSDFFYSTIKDSVPSLNITNPLYLPFSLGRIPAQTTVECSLYVQKVIRYEQSQKTGAWFNTVQMSTDDAYQGAGRDPLFRDHIHSGELLTSITIPC